MFEINNAVPHRVTNSANSWRIHLLLDFSEDEIPPEHRFAFEPGQTCGYHDLNACARTMQGGTW